MPPSSLRCFVLDSVPAVFLRYLHVHEVSRVSTLDALLLLMAIIWGTNYVVIKSALRRDGSARVQRGADVRGVAGHARHHGDHAPARQVAPASADRQPGLSEVFHTPAKVTRGDWLRLAALGLVGHCLYQVLLHRRARPHHCGQQLADHRPHPGAGRLDGLASAGTIAIKPLHWAGTLLSFAGIYFVVGHGARLGDAGLRGDAMVVVAVVCWAIYTVASRPLMERHSPVGVTGLSMTLGTLMFVPLTWPALIATELVRRERAHLDRAVLLRALFAVSVAYTIWYAAVREIGSARTSVYSNLVPIVAMVTAVFWLGEPLSPIKAAGAAAVLVGVGLDTRFRRTMDWSVKSHYYSQHAVALRGELGSAISRQQMRELHEKVALRHFAVTVRQFAILALATWGLIRSRTP